MWDIYRTQLPLLTTLLPDKAVELAQALLSIAEEEGNLPIGYRMARGADQFSRQASRARAHVPVRPVPARAARHGLGLGARAHAQRPSSDVRRGVPAATASRTRSATRSTWRSGTGAPSQIAAHVGDPDLVEQFAPLAAQWVNAYDASHRACSRTRRTTRAAAGTTRSGCMHDMAARIKLSGGDDAFVAQLDQFFGYGAPAVVQPGLRPGVEEMAAGYALNRFEGLNNEPDMEAPWAYQYAGRPDRTAEVVQAIVQNQFAVGPRRDARQRRLRRPVVLVRLGVARAVPRRRPEPLPHQRAGLARVEHRRRRPQPEHRDPRVHRADT